jgi:hypothetical protein
MIFIVILADSRYSGFGLLLYTYSNSCLVSVALRTINVIGMRFTFVPFTVKIVDL